ncbi:hypothetical protein, partial [Rhizobium sp. BK212]|uniref:hypothetical protein n=1 Tax=Rhizobium sp. BK212 TaxID=2587074 RepID=UPI001AEE70C4
PKPRSSTTPCWTNQPWLHNLNQTASGKPGAVHNAILHSVAYELPASDKQMTALHKTLNMNPSQI